MKYAIVMTTTDKRAAAAKMAKSLVSKKLAACVQAFPMHSTFSWKGRVSRSREWMLLIKARASDYKAIEKEIRRIHSYEIPEIIAVPILKGSRDYLGWIDKITKR